MTQRHDELTLDALLDWAASVTFDDLPVEAVAAAHEVVLDDLGAIVAGHREPEVRALLAGWPRTDGPASVLCSPPERAHPWTAAELNGTAGCWLELDGGFRIATAHAGLYTLPIGLATAETADLSLRSLVTALVVGYEVAARIVTTWDVVAAGSHAHGSVAPVAAAMTCGKAIGLARPELAGALGTAATLTMTAPFNHAVHGSLARNVWAGQAARLGAMAAHAAAHGVGGLSTSLGDVYGDVLSAPPWAGRRPGGFGTAVVAAYHKPYSCCQYLHSAIEAVLDVRRQLEEKGLALGQVTEVRVAVAGKAGEFVERTPTTSLGARFSLPHAVASSLVMGTGGPAAFSRESTGRTEVVAMRRRVHLLQRTTGGDDGLDDRGATVEVSTDDGSTFTAEVVRPLGDPDRPFTPDELVQKFADLVDGDAPAETAARARAVLDGELDDRPAGTAVAHLLEHVV